MAPKENSEVCLRLLTQEEQIIQSAGIVAVHYIEWRVPQCGMNGVVIGRINGGREKISPDILGAGSGGESAPVPKQEGQTKKPSDSLRTEHSCKPGRTKKVTLCDHQWLGGRRPYLSGYYYSYNFFAYMWIKSRRTVNSIGYLK
jgi:hypothetical protein